MKKLILTLIVVLCFSVSANAQSTEDWLAHPPSYNNEETREILGDLGEVLASANEAVEKFVNRVF